MDIVFNPRYRKILKQTLISLLCIIAGFAFLVPKTNGLNVQALDGTVGLGIPLQSSITNALSPVVFQVIKPDGTVLYISGQTDETGIAKKDLESFHTKKAGTYKVAAKLESEDSFGEQTNFILHARDEMYKDNSQATLSANIVKANGMDASILTVNIRDEFDNPIEGHPISVSSDKSFLEIKPISQSTTNQEGKVNFYIRSSLPANATLIITDIFSIDPYDSQKYQLTDRPTLTFIENTPISFVPNNTLTTNIMADSFATGGVKLILDAPAKVQVNNFFDITIKVETSQGTPSRDYRGTILFSSDDPNADLPLEQSGYTFTGKEESSGVHTFPKATRYTTKGFHELVVTDVDRPNIETKTTIEVVSELSDIPEGTKIKILSPTSGITIGKTSTKVLGSTLPNSVVGLFEDNILKSKIITSQEGSFEFVVNDIQEGEHTFIVKLLNSADNVLLESGELKIFIDTKPPEINSISISPEGTINPDTLVTIRIMSEPSLNSTRLTIGKLIYPMKEDPISPGNYSASFSAPQDGTYKISVKMTDKNGNENDVETNREIIVKSLPLPQIIGLKLDSSGTDNATISWDTKFEQGEPEEYSFEIELTKPDKTTQDFTTQNKNEKQFEATGLETEQSYSVKVRGIVTGIKGAWSNPLNFQTKKSLAFESFQANQQGSGIKITWNITDPNAIEKTVISYGIKGKGYLESEALDPKETSLSLSDLIGGIDYIAKLEGMKGDKPIISAPEISFQYSGKGLSQIASDILGRGLCQPLEITELKINQKDNGEQEISWVSIPYVDYYEVHIGSTPGGSDIGIFTVKSPPFPVPFVDNGQKFNYFSVKAGCSYKKLVGTTLSKSLKVNTGPALLLILIMATGSLLGTFAYYKNK